MVVAKIVKKEGIMMKFPKVAIAILSLSLVTACSNDTSPNVDVAGNTKKTEEKITKEHQSTELPVTIYTKDNYNSVENATFIRSIESVEVTNFSDDTVVDFIDRYDSQIKEMNLDLINDYKRVKISMLHSVEGENTKRLLEAFILDESSEVIFNNEPIADEVVAHQVKLSTLDYRMGENYDNKGEIILAIPKKYFQGILQLKTISRNKENNEVIYIDLK